MPFALTTDSRLTVAAWEEGNMLHEPVYSCRNPRHWVRRQHDGRQCRITVVVCKQRLVTLFSRVTPDRQVTVAAW
jgi:hypothetical protein